MNTMVFNLLDEKELENINGGFKPLSFISAVVTTVGATLIVAGSLAASPETGGLSVAAVWGTSIATYTGALQQFNYSLTH